MGLIRRFLRWLSGPPALKPEPGGVDLRAQLLAAVNARRSPAVPLAADPALSRAAQAWAEYMAFTGALGHGDYIGRARAEGFGGGPLGECVAGGQATPEEAVSSWVLSPAHFRIMTGPQFRFAGCGVASRPGGWVYYVLDVGG